MTEDKFAAISKADEYLPYREATLSTAQKGEYRALKREWDLAVKAAEAANDDGVSDIEKYDTLENAAWDSLVDWVEDNDLNWTKYDPRGPELVDPHSTERQS